METPFQSKTEVYDLTRQYYLNKYGAIYSSYDELFSVVIPKMILSKANNTVPSELLDILEHQITDYCKSIQDMIALSVDISRLTVNSSSFFTLLKQTTVSRLITEVLKSKGIKTVGLPPNITSTFSENQCMNVDEIGVVDEVQKEFLIKSGFDFVNLHNIGSISVVNELLELADCDIKDKKDVFDIYFELPLVSESLLIPIIRRLKVIITKYDLKVVVKPNDKHILPTYYNVRNELSNMDNVKVLPRDSKIEFWIVRSKIIIGTFNTNTLISAIYGKDTAIGYFNEPERYLHYYINLAHFNFLSDNGMEEIIVDLLNQKCVWLNLQKTKKEYSSLNPQFSTPYTSKEFEEFINSQLLINNE